MLGWPKRIVGGQVTVVRAKDLQSPVFPEPVQMGFRPGRDIGGPDHRVVKEKDVVGEGVWLDSHGLADAARDRNDRDERKGRVRWAAKGNDRAQAAFVSELFRIAA